MKALYTTFALIFTLTVFATAQAASNPNETSVQVQAMEQTRLMSNYIHFNEYEYICIRKINQLRLQELQEARNEYATEAELLAKKVKSIEASYEEAILKVLNPKQQLAFAQYKKNTATPVFTAAGN